jgi:pimeloyl-ACP methyl ester carboxylesterase
MNNVQFSSAIEISTLFTTASPKIALAAIEQPDAQPLLFIHAVTMGSYEFEEHFLPYFAQNGYAAYAMNWRGHGASEGKADFKSHGLLDYYQDLENVVHFIKEKTGKAPILIGHSTGGILTQIYISRHPVSKAVFLGIGTGELSVQGLIGFLATHFPEKLQQYGQSGNSDVLMKDRDVEYALMFTEENRPANYEFIIDRMVAQAASDKLFMDYNSYKTAPAMGSPKVLSITGDQDPIGTIEAVAASTALYKGTYHVVKNHRHDLTLSHGWKEVAEKINTFLSAED